MGNNKTDFCHPNSLKTQLLCFLFVSLENRPARANVTIIYIQFAHKGTEAGKKERCKDVTEGPQSLSH